jgi:hypothetical protein
LNETTEQNTILNNLSGEINNSNDLASNAQFTINNGDKIITIYPKSNNVDNLIGNENDISHNIFFNNFTTGDYFLVDISTNIQDAFNNYIDPITNEKIFQGTTVSIINKNLPDQDNEIEIKMNIKLNKTLRPRDYSIKFVDNIVDNGDGTYTNDNGDTLNNLSEKRTWKEYLKIDDSMIDNPYDLSAGDINVTTILNNDSNVQVGILDNERNVLINAINILDPRNLINIVSGVNDTIKIIGVENGVYSSGGENDITLTLNSNEYNKVTLIDEINRVIQNYNNTNENITFEGKIYIIQKEFTIDDETKLRDVVKIDVTVTRRYFANDYKVVFYDNTSFVTCYVGVSSVRNTTWDSTLGWVLGYRLFTIYDLSVLGSSKGTAVTIDGDTGVSTNLYNYFLLCLDDYNQNHLNDGLVTISNNDTTIPLPSYVNRTDFQCDPITGEKIYNIDSNLTDKQLYAANQIANMTTNQTTIGTSVSAKSYGTGPYVKDVFGLIPIKSSGLLSGDSYVEFGGTLQNQERSYFGPVNVQRLTIRLMTDRGDVVDLNNANWSFSLICEQLNKTTNNE